MHHIRVHASNSSPLTHVVPKSSRDFLVTPGRMVPSKGGVAISGSTLIHTKIANIIVIVYRAAKIQTIPPFSLIQ